MPPKNDCCFCGSRKPFSECCKPYLEGKKVLDGDTPEYVLRSRFSACVLGDGEYMLKTWDENFRPKIKARFLGQEIKSQNYTKLEIVSITLDNSDRNKAQIEFFARFRQNRSLGYQHELSSFIKKDGVWYYTDGVILD
ncbi:MAG: YchJ family metal-binding protein [Succinivibrionaceae bacterium]|nr:YchJ family metal-binding protein [Succinivibrionaceae bacterium]